MDKDKFVELFADQFDDTPAESFSVDTEFRSLEEWDSMVALMVIAMIDEEYNVKVTGDDIRNSTTIADLMQLVASKK